MTDSLSDGNSNGANPHDAQADGNVTAVINVGGMHCGGCSGKVKAALLALPGVSSAEVSHIKGTAVVSYDPAQTSIGALGEAVKASGYSVSPAAA